MVAQGLFQHVAVLMMADGPTKSVLERMPAWQRAAVMMTMLGLVLLGLTLVVCVMIGGRWVRRQARQQPRSQDVQDSASRLANRRLRNSLESVFPETNTSATVHIDGSTDETKIDRSANE